MRVNEHCAKCLWDKQLHRSDNREYLADVRKILDSRREEDTAPYLVYLFNQAYRRYYGEAESYRQIKQTYNDFVLSMEDEIRNRIEGATDPVAAALAYARIGNYIDFGAMNYVDKSTFLSLLDGATLESGDWAAYMKFTERCKTASNFLLIADNCGEIVLDKLFLEQMHKAFPNLNFTVMVRGTEVLNDATTEDAEHAGIDALARIVSNGTSVAGTVYSMLSDDARTAMDSADVILAKGQGNYESLCGQGRRIFYSLLCKCGLFTERFQVPALTGIFAEES